MAGFVSANYVVPYTRGAPIMIGAANVPEPTGDSSIATKHYVDLHSGGGGAGVNQLRVIFLSTAGSAAPDGLTINTAFATLDAAATAANSIASSTTPVVISCGDAGIFTSAATIILSTHVSLYAPYATFTGTGSLSFHGMCAINVYGFTMSGGMFTLAVRAGRDFVYTLLKAYYIVAPLNLAHSGTLFVDIEYFDGNIVTTADGGVSGYINMLGNLDSSITATLTSGWFYLNVESVNMSISITGVPFYMTANIINTLITTHYDALNAVFIGFNYIKIYPQEIADGSGNISRITFTNPFTTLFWKNASYISGLWSATTHLVPATVNRFGTVVTIQMAGWRLAVAQQSSSNVLTVAGVFENPLFYPKATITTIVHIWFTDALGVVTNGYGTVSIANTGVVTIYNRDSDNFDQFISGGQTMEMAPITFSYNLEE